MKIFDSKKSSIKIEDDDLKDAKLSVAEFTNEEIKKRAFIDVLGARLAMKLFFSQKIKANNLYSLYTIHSVLEDMDIADIYYNEIKIDVRLVFNKDEIFIPRSQYEYNLLPDLYAVLLLNEDMSSVEFLGFFEPKDLNKQNTNGEFYFYEYEHLQKPDKLKNFLDNFVPEYKYEAESKEIENIEELFVSLIDKEITDQSKRLLFKHLAANFSLREKFVEFENFETLSKEVAKKEELFQDGLLEFVGAQKVAEDEGPQSKEEMKAQIYEEVLSDVLQTEEEHQEPISQKVSPTSEEKSSFLEELAGGTASAIAGAAAGAAAGAVAGAAGALAAEALNVAPPSVGIDLSSLVNIGDDEDDFEKEIEEGVKRFLPKTGLESEPASETADINENAVDSVDETVAAEKTEEPIEEPVQPLNKIKQDDEEENLLGALPDINIGEEEFTIKEAKSVEAPETAVQANEAVDLDDFDFEKISEELNEVKEVPEEEPLAKPEATDDNLISLDSFMDESTPPAASITPEPEPEPEEATVQEAQTLSKEDEVLKRFSDMEKEEEPLIPQEKQPQAKSELISELDELLQNMEKLPENSSLLNNLSEIDDLHKEIIKEKTDAEVVYIQKEETEEPASQGAEPSIGPPSPNKDLIEALFEKEKISEELKNDIEEDTNKFNLAKVNSKKMLIVASVASAVVISSLISLSIVSGQKSNAPVDWTHNPNAIQGQPINGPMRAANGPDAQNLTRINPDEAQQAISDAGSQPAQSEDMSRSVSNAFSTEPVNANVSKVAWEVPEDIAYNGSFRKYLQIAGKSLKLNLQNNLLLATEMAYSNKVVVDLEINKDGTLKASNISVSSGSKQIDNIVLQSVKDTLKYLKMPSDELTGRSVVATLIINF